MNYKYIINKYCDKKKDRCDDFYDNTHNNYILGNEKSESVFFLTFVCLSIFTMQ